MSLSLFANSELAFKKKDLGALEKKLYAYILKTQIKEHQIPRYIGTWPSYPKYSGARKEIPESNSFMTLQTLILLHEVNKDFHLPHIQTIYTLANIQLNHYVQDAKKTDEPNGTLSFWPLIQAEDGSYIRSFDTQWYNTSMRILDVGNDFDTSSQAFVWFYKNSTHTKFLDGFVHSVSLFTDTNRSSSHPLNIQWKEENTGAFLTWAEEEAPKKSPNRIMDLVNDVDCVVNLNILGALSLYENTIKPLPPKTQVAKEKSCLLIHDVIVHNKEDRCGTWYTRPSYFYLAFAKAYKADTYCIDQDLSLILKRAKKRSKYLLQHPKMHAYTEIAEYIIILKTLKDKKRRSYLYKNLLRDLEFQLKQGITKRKDYAYLPSKQSLFGGEAFGLFHFNWYGRANATALALRALSMP